MVQIKLRQACCQLYSSSRVSDKVPGSCLHLHPLEGIAFSSSPICQDIPGPPVDAISHPAVAPTVITSVWVSRQAGIKPPACAVVLSAVPRGVAVVVSVRGAEGSPVVIVAFVVTQGVACVAGVFPRRQPIPGRNGTRWYTRVANPNIKSSQQPLMHNRIQQLETSSACRNLNPS